jgi:AcrR family transcriptional regulator
MVRLVQKRTTKTRERLLEAAQRVFVREGFEKARVDVIAAEAGRTKGAVYAHFESKERLFLSLLEQRMTEAAARTLAFISREAAGRPERFGEAFRTSFVELHDPSWAILHLELKLHAMRNPTSRARLRSMYRRAFDSMSAVDVQGLEVRGDPPSMRNCLAALSTIVSAVVLDMHFEPDLMTLPEARRILGEVFDGLLRNLLPRGEGRGPGLPRRPRQETATGTQRRRSRHDRRAKAKG